MGVGGDKKPKQVGESKIDYINKALPKNLLYIIFGVNLRYITEIKKSEVDRGRRFIAVIRDPRLLYWRPAMGRKGVQKVRFEKEAGIRVVIVERAGCNLKSECKSEPLR